MINAKKRGFKQSFSAYIAWLIERDNAGGVLREGSPAAAETSNFELGQEADRVKILRKKKK